MQCSVCGAEAEDLTSGDFSGIGVRCKHCGEYAVADSALNAFLRLDFDARVAALEKAKGAAPPGDRPTITDASFR
jgi:transposase